jgi:thiol-disulfide isomerase/thioredoxin
MTNALLNKEVLFCSTDTCSKCRTIEPHVDRMMQNKVDLRYTKVYDFPTLSSLKVTVVPTVIVLKDNIEIARIEDIHALDDYKQMIEALSNDTI